MNNLLSVNVSQPQRMNYRGKHVMTGIFKKPVTGRVMVRRMNIDGDAQADLENHGGIHKAVYAYPHEHYAYWSELLDRQDFTFGQFGENLTTEGLLEAEVHIGDVIRINDVLLQVTQPRVPCFKLATKMNEPGLPKPFLASGRVGFYLRVLKEGQVGAGDPISRERVDPEKITVQTAVRLAYFDKADIAGLRRVLLVDGLSPDWRELFEQRLDETLNRKEA
jgi:MOSC domain-containing protein YiiM